MKESLSKVHPELVCEWSEKNLPVTPDEVTFGSKRIFWWKGICGHEWQASIKARHSGEKCPICANMRVAAGINDLKTLFPELSAEWSDRNEVPASAVTPESHKKAWWRGACGHEWEAEIRSRAKNGTGCPFCANHKLLPGFNDLKTRFPDVAKEWSLKNRPLRPDMVTAFANRKVWWRCRTCGNEWQTLISTRSGGSKCPYCSGITLLPGFNDLKTKYPYLATEWSSRNGDLLPDAVNEKSRRNVWWKCSICGNEYKSLVKSRVNGLICPVCANRAVRAGYNDFSTTDRALAREWDFERNAVLPTMVSRYSAQRAWWKCKYGHSWSMRISDRAVEGKGCIYCEQAFSETLPGLAVAYYASRNNLHAIIGDEKLLGLQIGAFVPEIGLAIDFDEGTGRKASTVQAWKRHVCDTRGITFIEIQIGRKYDKIRLLQSIKKAFQKKSIHFRSDEEEDLQMLRNAFNRLRERNVRK